jgi:hypothetical protein
MMCRSAIVWLLAFSIGGCSVQEVIRRSEDRYLRPGALDSPLNNIYSVYPFKLMDRYWVTYQWISSSGCDLRALRLPRNPHSNDPFVYRVPPIYEATGKTWQGSYVGDPPWDLDRWVRSVKEISESVGQEGQIVEVGLNPLCFEAWWNSSHYLLVRLRKASLDEVQREVVGGSGIPVQWTRRTLNGMEWQVVKVPPEQMETRRPNGSGGLYETWITALGDTGYAIAFSLGASKESLDHPRAHAAFEATFRHLLNSLKVEPL